MTALCACKKKKNELPGSPYTSQIAGTRNYVHVKYLPSNPLPVILDTVPLAIEYINDTTVKIQTYTLVYNTDHSNDSVCAYFNQPADLVPYSAELSYVPLENRVNVLIINYPGTASYTYDAYESL